MKITYYRTHYTGYSIFADFIDTEDPRYVRHDDREVVVRVNATDVDGYEKDDEFNEVSYFLNYVDEKADTLNRLKSHVSRMQRLVDDLDASTHAINENVNKVPLAEYLTKINFED
jgi:hypothetical protein